MRDFKALRPMGSYKDTNAWIDAVYRNNKTIIDQELTFNEEKKEKLIKRGININLASKPQTIFKQMAKEYIKEGISPTKAIKTIARSTIFTPVSERLNRNAMAGLRKDKNAYKLFRELSKESGKYAAIDKSKLRWDASSETYVYDDKIIINYRNSPLGIEVSKIK